MYCKKLNKNNIIFNYLILILNVHIKSVTNIEENTII